MSAKEFEITANYIGEDTEEEVLPPHNELPYLLLQYLYESNSSIKEENASNLQVSVYDLMDAISHSNFDLALDLYQNILFHFAEYLQYADTAYYLVDPFLEILLAYPEFSLLAFLKEHMEIAELLYSDNCYISDLLLDCLIEAENHNDLLTLETYISLLNRNRYFEKNPESLFWEDIIDTLSETITSHSSKEMKEYVSQLKKS